ncbi:MAG TPA: phage holin family protein [Gaiellaceae bacterium]|jgi:fatty acid desaturase|nr:phage holin family protein [Gaiellaceae bacterium]
MFNRNGHTEANGSATAAAKNVVEHVRNLVKLELELATMEVRQKAKKAALGVGLAAAGAFAGLLALLFLVAAATAAIATAVSVWLALLIIGAALLLVALVGVLLGVRFLKRTSPPVPERAIEEAKRTAEAMRS